MITTFNISSPYFALVEWDPPTTPNGLITHYNLYVDYENGTSDTFTVEGQTTVWNITELLPYQFISVEMSANTSIGEGPRCPRVIDQTAQSSKQAEGMSFILVKVVYLRYIHPFPVCSF
jgi:hypothetical protein